MPGNSFEDRLLRDPGATATTSSDYHWEIDRGLAAIERRASAWNELAHAGSLSPTADAIYMRCFWGAFWGQFGSDDRALVLHSLYEGDRLLAVLPLQRRGRILRAWFSITIVNHTPYTLFAVDENRFDVAGEILEHLLESAEVVEIERIHAEGPLCRALCDAAVSRGLTLIREDDGGDTTIELAGDWEEFRRSLSRNIRETTERKMRKLERLGNLTLEVATAEAGLNEVLTECFELEASGWKGEKGVTLKSRPTWLQFYSELALSSAAARRLALYTLRLDGKLVAYEYCIRAQNKIDMLKISYQPGFGRYSPGNVLRYMILRREIEKGEISSYHLGQPSEWKLRWAKRVDPLTRLKIFRGDVRGALAYGTGPMLRDFLKRSSLFRAAVNRVRRVG
jgi:CelD/BcsL family acetyltransferase involved in cellulose biosynthesis